MMMFFDNLSIDIAILSSENVLLHVTASLLLCSKNKKGDGDMQKYTKITNLSGYSEE